MFKKLLKKYRIIIHTYLLTMIKVEDAKKPATTELNPGIKYASGWVQIE